MHGDEWIWTRDLTPGIRVRWPADTIDGQTVYTPATVISVEDAPGGMTVRVELVNGMRGTGKALSTRGWQVLTEHHPVCASCGGLWPCRDQTIANVARRHAQSLDWGCVICRKPIRNRVGTVRHHTPDGLTFSRYHTNKGSRCRRAYEQAIAGDLNAYAALQREDAECQQRRG